MTGPDEPEDEPPPDVTPELRDAVERDEDAAIADGEGRDRHI